MVMKQYKWNPTPKIGWWKDRNYIYLYHGTHMSRLDAIDENGINAPTSGPTANWVSLALEPNTSHGYASMSGGESSFRAAGSKAVHVPENERVVLIIKMPVKYVLKYMNQSMRGNIDWTRDRLVKKELYDEFSGKDNEYYALTEIRFPKKVDRKFIVGYMTKKRVRFKDFVNA